MGESQRADIGIDADALGRHDSSQPAQCIGGDAGDGELGKPLPQSLPQPSSTDPATREALRFAHPKRVRPPLRSKRRQRWTTPAMIAVYMGVDPDTVRNWLRRLHLGGKVTHHRHYTDDRARKTGRGHWRIFEGELNQLLRAMRMKGPAGFGAGFWKGKGGE